MSCFSLVTYLLRSFFDSVGASFADDFIFCSAAASFVDYFIFGSVASFADDFIFGPVVAALVSARG